MSEIERAIECFKKKVWSGELYETEVDMYNAVIKLLRAELDREKNPPPTVKGVLLERWAKDTEAMAGLMIGYDECLGMFYTTDIDGNRIEYYVHISQAHSEQIAYINSAAEVGK